MGTANIGGRGSRRAIPPHRSAWPNSVSVNTDHSLGAALWVTISEATAGDASATNGLRDGRTAATAVRTAQAVSAIITPFQLNRPMIRLTEASSVKSAAMLIARKLSMPIALTPPKHHSQRGLAISRIWCRRYWEKYRPDSPGFSTETGVFDRALRLRAAVSDGLTS